MNIDEAQADLQRAEDRLEHVKRLAAEEQAATNGNGHSGHMNSQLLWAEDAVKAARTALHQARLWAEAIQRAKPMGSA